MKNHVTTGLMKLSALCLVFAVLLSSSTLILAAPGAKAMSAEIIVTGNDNSLNPSVTLNGERVTSGRTFLSSAVIVTSDTGSAVVNIGKAGRVTLLPGSNLNLTFTDNSISGDLSSGQVTVASSEGVAVNIKTPTNTVTGMGGTMTVDASGAQTKDDDDDDHKGAGIWLPVLIFAGVVGAAAAFTLTNGDDDTNISGSR